MAITTQDALLAAMAAGETFVFPPLNIANASLVNSVTGQAYMSSWTGSHRTGALPATMRVPETCDATTVGAAALPALTAGNQYYLASLQHGGSTQVTTILLDRLAHVRIDPSISTAQTVNMTLPARASARGVLAFAELTSNTSGAASLGAFPLSMTMSYTNELGQSGRTGSGFDHAGAATNRGSAAGGLIPLMMAADQGITSVESVTFGTTSASFGMLLVLARVVYFSNQPIYSGSSLGFLDGIGPNLGTSPCLFWGQYLSSFAGTNAPGTLITRIIQG